MEGEVDRDIQIQAAQIANETIGNLEVGEVPFLETDKGMQLLSKLEELLSTSMTDSLTGLYRPKVFLEGIDKIVSFAKRQQDKKYQALVVGLDLIGLKRMNDNLGHEGADRVLSSLGFSLKEKMRDYDLACRWSGDEFALFILIDSSEKVEAESIIQRIISGRPKNVELHVGYSLMDELDEEKIKDKVKLVIDKMEEVKKKGILDETGRAVGKGVFVNIDTDLK